MSKTFLPKLSNARFRGRRIRSSFSLLLTLLGAFAGSGAAAQTYCTTGFYTYGCSSSDFIQSFSTTGGTTNITNNNTGCTSASLGYASYTNMTHSGVIGTTVNWSYTNCPVFTEWYAIFVDWNQNGTLNDAGEVMFAQTQAANPSGTTAGATVTGSFTIPATAIPGNTRMRIRCVYYPPGTITPCGAETYGEIEDYTLNVIQPAPCSGTPTAANITTAPSATPVCLGATKALSATHTNIATQLAYQWEQGPTATGPWTNVTAGTGATTLNYTTGPLTAETWYRMRIDCPNSGQSAASAPYQVRVGLAALGNITGSGTFCPGVTQTYSVPALTGASTYGWSLPNGWTGTSTSNTITVTAGPNDGYINVTAFGTCGASPTKSLPVTFANPSPGINISSSTGLEICQGTSVVLSANTVSAGTSPSYQWFRNGQPVGTNSPTYTASGLSTGDSIRCLLTSNATCVATNTANSNAVSFSVMAPVVPTATITANPGTTNITPGQTVTFTLNYTNGGNNPVFQWMKNGVAVFGANGTTYTTNNLMSGDQITVELTSDAICAAPFIVTSNRLSINQTNSVGTLSPDAYFTLAPNPNTGRFTLAANVAGLSVGKPMRIEVLNALGQVVYAREVTPDRSKWSFDIQLADDMANGIYLLRLKADGNQAIQRFEVKR